MEILFLSHCVPNPPDKGEKIRAHHEVSSLARTHDVYLACLARNEGEMDAALTLRDRCVSVHVERVGSPTDLCRAAFGFAFGDCLTTSFYRSSGLHRHVESLRKKRLAATVAYSSAMAQYAPRDVPLLLDMTDVDSEKWMEYGRRRTFGSLYSLEGRRLRRLEGDYAAAAASTVVSTQQEADLLGRISPHRVVVVESGVDCTFFDPQRTHVARELKGRRFLVFVGTLDYYPNAEGVCRFAREIFPHLRRQHLDLELLVVGRNPPPRVRALARCDGIQVIGSVPDVRPYLAAAEAVVAPLPIARGMQSKVLEGLAMGKRVLASSTVCQTFGQDLPHGLLCCDAVWEYDDALSGARLTNIREAVGSRFGWPAKMQILEAELHRIATEPGERQQLGIGA